MYVAHYFSLQMGYLGFASRKPVFGFLRPGRAQTKRPNRILIFPYCKDSYTFQQTKNEGADQTALVRRLVSAFVFRMQQSQIFWGRGPVIY